MVRSNYPDPRLDKVARSLAAAGHQVEYIVWQREIPRKSRISSSFPSRTMRLPIKFGVTFALPIWWVFAIVHLLRSRPDIIHAVDLDSMLPARLANMILRRPVVYEIYDYYADVVRVPVLTHAGRWADQRFLRYADLIIIADESRHEQIGREHGRPVIVITNSPMAHQARNAARSAPAPFTVFLGGALLADRGLLQVIEAVRNMANVRLILKGVCPDPMFRARLLEAAKTAPNVEVHPERVPYEEILDGAAQSDLLFALYDPAVPNNRYASPNKLFESMLLGKPILVTKETSMEPIVASAGCGIAVEYNDVEGIRAAISQLATSPETCEAMGSRGRRTFNTQYGWEVMHDRLITAYARLLRRQ